MNTKSKGLTLPQLLDMIPDDAAAEQWFEEQRWPDGQRVPALSPHRPLGCGGGADGHAAGAAKRLGTAAAAVDWRDVHGSRPDLMLTIADGQRRRPEVLARFRVQPART